MLEGQSQVNVARDLQIGQTTVRYIWQKYMKMGDTADVKRSGRTRKTSRRQGRLLSRISKPNQFMTAREAWNDSKVMPDIPLTRVSNPDIRISDYSDNPTNF